MLLPSLDPATWMPWHGVATRPQGGRSLSLSFKEDWENSQYVSPSDRGITLFKLCLEMKFEPQKK